MRELATEARATGLNFWKFLLTAAALALFLIALWSAVAFFIGYASRITLVADAQQRDGTQSIDHIFMRIDELERDERALNRLRRELEELSLKHLERRSKLDAEINNSLEYLEYYGQLSALREELELRREMLTEKFVTQIRAINFIEPSLEQSQLFSELEFLPEVKPELRDELRKSVRALQGAFRAAVVKYLAKFKDPRESLDKQYAHAHQQIRIKIEAIVRRSPQLASERELKDYQVEPGGNRENVQAIDHLRAVLRSYRGSVSPDAAAAGGSPADNPLGLSSLANYVRFDLLSFDFLRFDRIVQLPTIVLTMVVTLAMGLLGGIVSFLRLMVESPERYTLTELIRRSTLGIAAATGIFLLAGSGLLILTAQSSKAFTPTSIELSPYFVAFLAFISGFMADEAFARLMDAGRSIFRRREEADEKAQPPAAGNDQAPPADPSATAPAGMPAR
jgi:Skp family chaperone for outer membrane proteins